MYNNERGRLHTAYQGRELARLAREAELKANPPQPQNITVRYWLKTTAPEIPDPTPYRPLPAAPPPRPAAPPQPRRPKQRPRRTGFQPVMENGLPACSFPSSICRHLAAVLLLTPLALLPARAALDSNNNGVSDIWELDTNSGQLFTTFDPAADDDGDGWTNAEEAAAGTLHTDATPPAGFFTPDFRIAPAVYETVDGITVETSPESFVLTFTGLPGKLYTVQHSPDLITWTTLGEAILCDGSPVEAGQPVGDGPTYFFRVTIADIDMDQDGLTDWEEWRSGTNPAAPDTDHDGVNDYIELAVNGTDPLHAFDLDTDGMADDLEKHLAKQLLAVHPAPEYWGAFHAGLVAGDLDPTHAYTGDGSIASVVPSFRILNPTSYDGYCGNALIATGTEPEDGAKNREDDFSFAADGDDRETEGIVENGAIRAPIFCKDYGAWCEVEVTLRKGSAVLGPPFTITLPLDRNHDRLADIWQDLENLKWIRVTRFTSRMQGIGLVPANTTGRKTAQTSPSVVLVCLPMTGRGGVSHRTLMTISTMAIPP